MDLPAGRRLVSSHGVSGSRTNDTPDQVEKEERKGGVCHWPMAKSSLSRIKKVESVK